MDFSKLSQNNMIAGGGGLLAFIASLLPWYGSNTGTIFDVNINGWSSGIAAWGGCLLALAGGALIVLKALEMFEGNAGNLSTEQLAMILAGLGFLLVVLRFLTATSGVKFGLFLGLIGTAAAAAGAFLSAKDLGIGLPSADDFTGGGGDSTGGGTSTF